jgi:hypothetical protein
MNVLGLLSPALAMVQVNQLWYALPLIVVISLVYAATRHEEMGPILNHAVRLGAWIVGCMAGICALLSLVSWWL